MKHQAVKQRCKRVFWISLALLFSGGILLNIGWGWTSLRTPLADWGLLFLIWSIILLAYCLGLLQADKIISRNVNKEEK